MQYAVDRLVVTLCNGTISTSEVIQHHIRFPNGV
jgi:hypothetical protein